MEHATAKTQNAPRAARHLKKAVTSSVRRVSVTVPSRDVPFVKALARALRSGGEEAKLIRKSIQSALATPTAKTGSDLVAFLRNSPFVECDLPIERNGAAGRSANLYY